MQVIREELKQILLNCVENESIDIMDDMDPAIDLKMDSIILLDFVIYIEGKYNIEIDDFATISEHMDTVGELLEYLTNLVETSVKY